MYNSQVLDTDAFEYFGAINSYYYFDPDSPNCLPCSSAGDGSCLECVYEFNKITCLRCKERKEGTEIYYSSDVE